MNQLELAVHQTVHEAEGGLKSLATDIGMGEQVLRNKANPYQDTHKLGLYEAVAIMRRTQDLRILEAMAAEFGRTVSQPIDGSPISLVLAVISADAEHGDVTRSVADAMKDKRWTQAEVANSRKQIKEARAALDKLEQAVIAEGKAR